MNFKTYLTLTSVLLLLSSSRSTKAQTSLPPWEKDGGVSGTNDNAYSIDSDNFGFDNSEGAENDNWLLFGRTSSQNGGVCYVTGSDNLPRKVGFVATENTYYDWSWGCNKKVGTKRFKSMHLGYIDIPNPSDRNTRARTNLMSLLENGNVGIGTATPGNRLQLESFAGVSGVGIGFSCNGGATPAQARIRVIDANWSGHMLFETSAPGSGSGALTERMRITNRGSLGIGTDQPRGKLDVNGALFLRNGNTAESVNKGQIFFGYNGSTLYRHAISSRHNSGSRHGNAIDFFLWKQGTDSPDDSTSTLNVMTLDGAHSGSVGIGTKEPSSRLHLVTKATRAAEGSTISVGGTSKFHNGDLPLLKSSLRVENTQNNTTSTYDARFGILTSGPSAEDDQRYPFLNIETLQDNVPIIMEVGDKPIMQLFQNQVLIGPNLSLPSTGVIPYSDMNYTLGVRGRIVSEGITCKALSTWADYVFDDCYDLKPLEEVADYVAKNKHLPDVPSAKEVIEEGLNMAEMMRIQMQKIEELTLYSIRQQQEINELKHRLTSRR